MVITMNKKYSLLVALLLLAGVVLGYGYHSNTGATVPMNPVKGNTHIISIPERVNINNGALAYNQTSYVTTSTYYDVLYSKSYIYTITVTQITYDVVTSTVHKATTITTNSNETIVDTITR